MVSEGEEAADVELVKPDRLSEGERVRREEVDLHALDREKREPKKQVCRSVGVSSWIA